MKKLLILSISFVLAILITGCEKTTEGISRITYFADLTMSGASTVFLDLGTPFTDPGVTAEESGQELPVDVSVTGTYFGFSGTEVDVNAADEYVIKYTAINSDGFPGSITRTVYVIETGDLVNNIAGLYTADIVRNGVTSAQYEGLQYIIISKTGDNTYQISDGIGGYYAIGRGYGNGYIAPGCVITANDIAANDFSYSPFSVATFGGSAEMSGMTVDAGAKTIFFETVWDAGYTFDVTLTQVNIQNL